MILSRYFKLIIIYKDIIKTLSLFLSFKLKIKKEDAILKYKERIKDLI